MSRRAQLNLRVTEVEKSRYERRRGEGMSADLALLELLQLRVSHPPFVVMPSSHALPTYKTAGRPQEARKTLPRGFKPDFKGGKRGG